MILYKFEVALSTGNYHFHQEKARGTRWSHLSPFIKRQEYRRRHDPVDQILPPRRFP